MTRTASAEALLALTDQCVMCGLCLPHCPTYALAGTESESPRGRIALARAIAGDRIAIDATSLTHLDQCLGCRSCESACPSRVDYEQILVQTRALIEPARVRRPLPHRLAAHPQLLTWLAKLAQATRAARWLPTLARALPAGSTLRRIARTLPMATTAPHEPAAIQTPIAGERIALFEGCVASAWDRDTLVAARRLLGRLGHDVVTPTQTLCCGALPSHAGHVDATERNAIRTRAGIATMKVSRVAMTASGCSASLRHTLAGSAVAVVDVAAVLAADPAFATLRFRPLPRRAALHLPCSQVNGGGSAAATRQLLARIPGLTVIELSAQPRCCGAAGSYYLEHPAIADRLRDERLAQIDSQAPDLLLTSNIGCRIHLANGLRQQGSAVPVVHPLTLLAQQLEEA